MERDDNSAVNILKRFLAGLPPYTPSGCDVLQDACLDAVGREPTQAGEVQQLN